jgi:acetolactate synthase-1/2/3 large subunit
MTEPAQSMVDRRRFLTGAVAGAATLAAGAAGVSAQADPQPAAALAQGEPGTKVLPAEAGPMTTEHPGADFMVDVIKSLGFDYICSNPGESFRGLHESVINYGDNQKPEFLTCCHEESSVAMAHGYAKIEGKPLCIFAHGTVGLQHAAMAIYNAYCDSVPVYIIVGNILDATMRVPGGDWNHSVQDAAAMVREFIKWDDTPVSLQHFAESAVRAYKIAMTPPMKPVLLVADASLQENPLNPDMRPHIPRLTIPTPPQGDSGAVTEAARLLVQAENPVIVVDRAARSQAGVDRLVELAETLQIPVIDEYSRMNFPSQHPLNQTAHRRALIAEADVILGIELRDFWGTVNSFRDQLQKTSHPILGANAKLMSLGIDGLYMKSNYQNIQRFREVDLDIAADAEATVPALIESIKRQMTGNNQAAVRQRGERLSQGRKADLVRARTDGAFGWDSSPITIPRLCSEVWGQIKDEDWSLVSDSYHLSWLPQRLWTIDKFYQFIGGPGGGGQGYGAPSCVGAALANRKYGRLSVSIQTDGDLMYANGILWTAAHHRIPILYVMYNNRAYQSEVNHLQRMACQHNRGIDRSHIGTTLTDPNIDFAKIAQGMGLYAEGPISDPRALAPALKRAIAVVKRGEPALLDVICQPR